MPVVGPRGRPAAQARGAAAHVGGTGAHRRSPAVAHILGRRPGVLRVQRVQAVPGRAAVPGQVRDVPGRGRVVLGARVVLRGQVRAVRVVVRVVQALVMGVAGDDARRWGRRGGGRGGRRQVRVGHMVRAAVQRQGRRAEGRV